jgi:hypothetical protein
MATVRRTPPGSSPGRITFATKPATSPRMIQARMPITKPLASVVCMGPAQFDERSRADLPSDQHP